MENEAFDISEWQPIETTSSQKLIKVLQELDFTGRRIKEIWNIGIVFNEEKETDSMYVELDEPLILVFDNLNLEILFSGTGLVQINNNKLDLSEVSYQGVSCNRNAEKYLSIVLNTPIISVSVKKVDKDNLDNPFGYIMPEQDEYIDEIIFKFESGYTLNIAAWYDYMTVYVKNTEGEIPKL